MYIQKTHIPAFQEEVTFPFLKNDMECLVNDPPNSLEAIPLSHSTGNSSKPQVKGSSDENMLEGN
jgi:hypothetical protein